MCHSDTKHYPVFLLYLGRQIIRRRSMKIFFLYLTALFIAMSSLSAFGYCTLKGTITNNTKHLFIVTNINKYTYGVTKFGGKKAPPGDFTTLLAGNVSSYSFELPSPSDYANSYISITRGKCSCTVKLHADTALGCATGVALKEGNCNGITHAPVAPHTRNITVASTPDACYP